MSFGVCPVCGYRFDQQTNVSRPSHLTPQPGDAGICAGCGEVQVFTATGVRPPTPEELRTFRSSTVLTQTREAIRRRGAPPKSHPTAKSPALPTS